MPGVQERLEGGGVDSCFQECSCCESLAGFVRLGVGLVTIGRHGTMRRHVRYEATHAVMGSGSAVCDDTDAEPFLVTTDHFETRRRPPILSLRPAASSLRSSK